MKGGMYVSCDSNRESMGRAFATVANAITGQVVLEEL
jgi:hypothetical protein